MALEPGTSDDPEFVWEFIPHYWIGHWDTDFTMRRYCVLNKYDVLCLKKSGRNYDQHYAW